MKITVAENAGFCFGVNRAVELVEQAAGQGLAKWASAARSAPHPK